MSWEQVNTVQSEPNKTRERIRGFLPFTESSNVEGTLEAVRINRDTNKGYYLIRATKASIVNVQDADSLSGQGKAQIGELVGVRKTGATKVLSRFPMGTLLSITYVGMQEKESRDPKNGVVSMCPYHNLTIEVYKEENQQSEVA
jgi:hypothetical protein